MNRVLVCAWMAGFAALGAAGCSSGAPHAVEGASAAASEASKHEFTCKRDDAKTTAANSVPSEYKKTLPVSIDGDEIKVNWSANSQDTATLKRGAASPGKVRFVGMRTFVDCANEGWVDASRDMLDGESGEIEITGEGNEDCGIGDVFYQCDAK
jgi:hypothetical protein